MIKEIVDVPVKIEWHGANGFELQALVSFCGEGKMMERWRLSKEVSMSTIDEAETNGILFMRGGPRNRDVIPTPFGKAWAKSHG